MTDAVRTEGRPRLAEVEHRYGERVHVFDNVLLQTALARLGGRRTSRKDVILHLRTIYESMAMMMSTLEFPTKDASVETRMAEAYPKEGVVRGTFLDPKTRVVIVDVIRGGILPAQFCFDLFESVLPEENVRLDHLNLAREVDEEGCVTGANLSGSKVGGPIDGSILLIPDPMGATGSTIIRVVEHYLANHGTPAKIIAMPMIATPEFFRAVLDANEQIRIYAGRIDRGLSSADVLATIPGTMWDQERGLSDTQYIVPGAGGVGEILNNSWC